MEYRFFLTGNEYQQKRKSNRLPGLLNEKKYYSPLLSLSSREGNLILLPLSKIERFNLAKTAPFFAQENHKNMIIKDLVLDSKKGLLHTRQSINYSKREGRTNLKEKGRFK